MTHACKMPTVADPDRQTVSADGAALGATPQVHRLGRCGVRFVGSKGEAALLTLRAIGWT